MKRHLLVFAMLVVGVLFFTPHDAGAQCPEDPNDLGICDTLYVEVFDCDHQYQADPGSFDSVRVAIYVTHDSNTFWWEPEQKWMQDSIAVFVIPLTFWDNGCADSVILPDWDNWNNTDWDPYHPWINRSIFRDIVDTHTGDTVYNRMCALAKEDLNLAWNTIILDVESHSSDGDSGHMYLSMFPGGTTNRRWWEGSRVLLATWTFFVYGLDEDCYSTQICVDSTIWGATGQLTFTRNDASNYCPRHFLPYCSSIEYIGCPGIEATSPAQNELNVPVSTNISVTFDTTMDETTINDSTFIVHARCTGLHQGTISYDSLTRTATFDPSDDFDVGEVVTVVLISDIKSSDGIPMINGYAWSFTTTVDHGAAAFAPQMVYPVGYDPNSVFAADLDGDRDLDLAVGDEQGVSILLNTGNGTFAPRVSYPTHTVPISIFAGDLDSDGDVDLVYVDRDWYTVAVLMNNGDGTFAPYSEYDMLWLTPQLLFAADLDGDGDLDLAITSLGVEISVLFNNGDGSFSPLSEDNIYQIGDVAKSIFAADLNNDGHLDLATANDVGEVSVLLNWGRGVFAASVNYDVVGHPKAIFASDLNEDGNIDLATANFDAHNVSVLLNNGDGTFAPHSVYSVDTRPYSVYAADLDGDHDLDLVAANWYSNNVSVLLNNGDGTFAPHSDYSVSDGPRSLFASDLDGDGDIDLATANEYSGNISILLNFSRGDANSDGKIDIADVVYLANYLFMDGPAPSPSDAGDANCDDVVNIADVVYLVTYLFLDGPPPGC